MALIFDAQTPIAGTATQTYHKKSQVGASDLVG